MTPEELQQLEEEERELNERLSVLAEKRRLLEEAQKLIRLEEEAYEEDRKRTEIKKMEELRKTRPITVTVLTMAGGGVVVESFERDDLVEVWRSTPGRAWRGYNYNVTDTENLAAGKNWIPLVEWNACLEKIKQLPNISVKWALGVEDEIQWYLTAPVWEITLHPNGREFLCVPGPRCPSTYAVDYLPGAAVDWNAKKKTTSVPTTEGWRLWEALEKVEGVVYSEDARERIFDQVKARALLDTIAKKKDSDHDVMFLDPTYKLRPFQRVGLEFLIAASGLESE